MKNWIIILVLCSWGFQCTTNKDPVSSNNTIEPDSAQVYKPNIYLYPETTIDVQVKLEFPVGGRVTVSDPDYNNGWYVSVTPEGLIDGQYRYLFYECKLYQILANQSWIVEKDSLYSFFTNNMKSFGFNSVEINDFTEYWMDRLPDYKKYAISPIFSPVLESYVVLNVAPKPDSVLRLFYIIDKAGDHAVSDEIEIHVFERKGFTAIEWGVILDND